MSVVVVCFGLLFTGICSLPGNLVGYSVAIYIFVVHVVFRSYCERLVCAFSTSHVLLHLVPFERLFCSSPSVVKCM